MSDFLKKRSLFHLMQIKHLIHTSYFKEKSGTCTDAVVWRAKTVNCNLFSLPPTRVYFSFFVNFEIIQTTLQ